MTAPTTRLFIQDVTLRDGMHAVRHRIDPDDVGRIVAALDAAGVDGIEVAHGDGLAGGSINYGPGSHTDWEWIEAAAANLIHARLTTLLLPGIGTIEELKQASALGVRSVRVATHCTEADVSAQHIATARELGMDVSGFLMMSHMAPADALAKQAGLMESYGAHCVYVTDSGGALLPAGVTERVSALVDEIGEDGQVGFHAHNNLGLAIGNFSIAGMEAGAVPDRRLRTRGLGAGAGNAPTGAARHRLRPAGRGLSAVDSRSRAMGGRRGGRWRSFDPPAPRFPTAIRFSCSATPAPIPSSCSHAGRAAERYGVSRARDPARGRQTGT